MRLACYDLPILLLLYASYTWYEVRRCVCDRRILGECVLVVQSPTPTTHITRDSYWLKGKRSNGCRCIAAAVPLLHTLLVSPLRTAAHRTRILVPEEPSRTSGASGVVALTR